jgi:hypothetical protein
VNDSPSRYGGIAAVFVLAIGLMAVGRAAAGIGVLSFGILAMAMMLCPSGSGKILFAGIGAVMLGAVFAYNATSNEITGTAIYLRPIRKGWTSVSVTRESSPAKFREATNYLWVGTLLCMVGGFVAFNLYRKVEYADDF